MNLHRLDTVEAPMNSLQALFVREPEEENLGKCWDHESVLHGTVLARGPAGATCTTKTKWAKSNFEHGDGSFTNPTATNSAK
jgi:hypothetical protein